LCSHLHVLDVPTASLLGLACRYSLLTSLRLLTRGYRMLREKCVVGITANEEVCMNTVTNSIGIVTALLPFIGYANASQAAKVALAEGKGVAEVVVQLGYLNAEQVAALLKPEMMTRPEEDAQPAGSYELLGSVDVVGGGEFSGYEAWKSNQDISGLYGNESSGGASAGSDGGVAPKSKL